MEFLWVLLFVWLVLPLGLIPAVIILAVKNSKLKKLVSGETAENAVKLPKKERKAISFTWILITGVLLVVVSGVLFASSNWDCMSGAVRAVLVMSMSVVFFSASFLSERRFGLRNTGFAFYILGGIFLPVSVMTVAFFEIFGDFFSFKEHREYMVFLVMLAVTVPVIIISGRRYGDSAVSRSVFSVLAASEYTGFAVSLSYNLMGDHTDSGAMILASGIITAGYAAFVLIPYLRTAPAQLVLIMALAGCSADDSCIFAASCALACTAVSVVINRKFKSISAIIILPFMVCNLVNTVVSSTEYGSSLDDIVPLAVSMALLAAASAVFGLFCSDRSGAVSENEVSESCSDRKMKIKWLERITGFAVFVIAFFGFEELSYHDDREWYIFGLVTAGYFAARAVTLHMSGQKCERSHSLMFACVLVSASLMNMEPLSIIEAEYFSAVSMIATLPLLYIWKNHRTLSENIIFVHTLIILALLIFNSYDRGELVNVVILAGICTLMAVISFIRKSGKWFILASAALTIVVLQLTSQVLGEVLWWVFLLAAGLIFIVYAAVNESCRRNEKENPIKNGIGNLINRVWSR